MGHHEAMPNCTGQYGTRVLNWKLGREEKTPSSFSSLQVFLIFVLWKAETFTEVRLFETRQEIDEVEAVRSWVDNGVNLTWLHHQHLRVSSRVRNIISETGAGMKQRPTGTLI